MALSKIDKDIQQLKLCSGIAVAAFVIALLFKIASPASLRIEWLIFLAWLTGFCATALIACSRLSKNNLPQSRIYSVAATATIGFCLLTWIFLKAIRYSFPRAFSDIGMAFMQEVLLTASSFLLLIYVQAWLYSRKEKKEGIQP